MVQSVPGTYSMKVHLHGVFFLYKVFLEAKHLMQTLASLKAQFGQARVGLFQPISWSLADHRRFMRNWNGEIGQL